VSRGIALLYLGPRHTRWGGGQPHSPAAFTPGKDPVPIVQETGWAPGPVWTGGKSRPHRDSIPDRPARSQSLYRLSYPESQSTQRKTCPTATCPILTSMDRPGIAPASSVFMERTIRNLFCTSQRTNRAFTNWHRLIIDVCSEHRTRHPNVL
jgi:hypothetical protein